MFRTRYLLPGIVMIAAVALGCTQRPTASTSGNDRALEAKVAKLEKDLKTLQDDAVKARAEAARQIADAAKQVGDLSKERDELKSLLKTRTSERDLAQSQYDGFRKELKELVGKMDAATSRSAPPVVTSLPSPMPIR